MPEKLLLSVTRIDLSRYQIESAVSKKNSLLYNLNMIKKKISYHLSITKFLLVMFTLTLTIASLGAGLYRAEALQNEPALWSNTAPDNPIHADFPPAYHGQEYFGTNLDFALIVLRSGKLETSASSILSSLTRHHAQNAAKLSLHKYMLTEALADSVSAKDHFHIRC
jgi:hypothetical protein